MIFWLKLDYLNVVNKRVPLKVHMNYFAALAAPVRAKLAVVPGVHMSVNVARMSACATEVTG